MMRSVSMASLEGSDDAVMSYAGLVDRATIQGRDVQLMHDDDILERVERRQDEERRDRRDPRDR